MRTRIKEKESQLTRLKFTQRHGGIRLGLQTAPDLVLCGFHDGTDGITRIARVGTGTARLGGFAGETEATAMLVGGSSSGWKSSSSSRRHGAGSEQQPRVFISERGIKQPVEPSVQ